MIEKLVREAVFGKNKKGAREKIKELTEKNGIWLDSTQKLYDKMMGIVLEEQSLFTVPAFNIRTLTFDVAKAVFRAVKKEKVGAFIFEIARSEINYTGQSPEEYIVVILGAAIEEGFRGPLFFQGDHFQINSKKYFSRTWKAKELKELKNLIRRAIRAGFYNIDIDCSTLKPLKENFSLTAKFTSFIRKIERRDSPHIISIGGEVGEIGDKDTTVEEIKIFMNGYKKVLSQCGDLKGIIKLAVQARTTHGGILLPSGQLKKIKGDFSTLKELSREAKKYGTAGIVQHGASTLPKKYFSRFPENEVCEIHLATNFQNIIYDSPYFPDKLKDKIYNWLKKKFQKQKKETETDVQFLYKFRKRALGPFKKEIWDIPQKDRDEISEQLEKEFVFLFKALKVSNTKNLIKKFYPVRKKSSINRN
jgi:fructose/tagatose bisphosphate aldolase